MPYRIDVVLPPLNAADRLVELGALDMESSEQGLAAILPDGVTPEVVSRELGGSQIAVSPVAGRDEDSVWLLSPRPVRLGRVWISAEGQNAPPDCLRLRDAAAFGSGHHPTTMLCAEILDDALTHSGSADVLDVGTGSGVLALAALKMGAPRVIGLDIDPEALGVAAENARLNGLDDRLELMLGGPESVTGAWPLVVANVLAAPLIEMASTLARCVASGGRLILSGIPCAVEREVEQAYVRRGMRFMFAKSRGGWSVLVLQPTW